MKRYFFLDQSDYFTHFLDLASTELKRPAREVSLTKLQSLMDLVLRNPSSVTVNDVFKEDLKVDMSHLSLVDQLLRIINVGGLGLNQGQGQGFADRGESRASNQSRESRAPLHSRVNSGSGQNGHAPTDSWHEEMFNTLGGGPSRTASSMEGVMATANEAPPATNRGPLSGDYEECWHA